MVGVAGGKSIEGRIGRPVVRIRRIFTPIGSMRAVAASHGSVDAAAAKPLFNAKLLELRSETATDAVALSASSRFESDLQGISPQDLERSVQECEQLLDRTAEQLEEYFRGHRFDFDLPFGLYGTGFQLKVWEHLRRIGYSQTQTYSQLAGSVGVPRGGRAVGAALGRNPLWIVLPCHRVIGKTGNLVGYAGGLDIKRYLVELEKKHATG